MADSIKELIMLDLVAAHEAISKINGYMRDADIVQRFRSGVMKQSSQVIIEVRQGNDIKVEEAAIGTEERSLTVFVIFKIRQDPPADKLYPDYDTPSTDTVLNEHEADSYRATLQDKTRGGLAFDTTWQSTGDVDLDEDAGRVIMVMTYEVRYRHILGDMTN